MFTQGSGAGGHLVGGLFKGLFTRCDFGLSEMKDDKRVRNMVKSLGSQSKAALLDLTVVLAH